MLSDVDPADVSADERDDEEEEEADVETPEVGATNEADAEDEEGISTGARLDPAGGTRRGAERRLGCSATPV